MHFYKPVAFSTLGQKFRKIGVMKNILLLWVVFILPLAGSSQRTVEVHGVTLKMSKGENPGFEAEIPSAGLKDVEKDWRHRLMAGNKARPSELNGEIAIRGIDNKDIAPKLFNAYAIITATTGGVKIDAFFTYDDTTFFTGADKEGAAASNLVRDFAGAEYYLAVKNTYTNERQKLEKLKDALEKSIRTQEKANLKINENKRAISRAQEDLATNDADQKEAIEAINLQQAAVNKDRSGNAEIYKAADNALKQLQDAEIHLKSRADELHKRIDELNKEITSNQRDIDTSANDQAKTTASIETQKQLIKDLAAKLKAIKLL